MLGTKSLYSLLSTEILTLFSRFKLFIVKAEPSALIVPAVNSIILLSVFSWSSVSLIKADVNLPVVVKSPDTEVFPFKAILVTLSVASTFKLLEVISPAIVKLPSLSSLLLPATK